ncbi:hypothetical protein LCGC14_2500920, partial [marine sediment metagenome]
MNDHGQKAFAEYHALGTDDPVAHALTRNALDWWASHDFQQDAFQLKLDRDRHLSGKVHAAVVVTAFESERKRETGVGPYFEYPALDFIVRHETKAPEDAEAIAGELGAIRQHMLAFFRLLLNGAKGDGRGTALLTVPLRHTKQPAAEEVLHSTSMLLLRHVALHPTPDAIEAAAATMASLVASFVSGHDSEKVKTLQVDSYNDAVEVVESNVRS